MVCGHLEPGAHSPFPQAHVVPQRWLSGRQQRLQQGPGFPPGRGAQPHEGVEGGLWGDREEGEADSTVPRFIKTPFGSQIPCCPGCLHSNGFSLRAEHN